VEEFYLYTTTFIKANYTVKQGDLGKALWGLLYSWLVWKQDRDALVTYHKPPNNVAENIYWLVQYHQNGQIDFLFYPPIDDNKPGQRPYLRFHLDNNKITTTKLE